MATTKGKKNLFQLILKLLSYIVIAFVCVITFFLLYYIVSSQIHAKDANYRPGISIYTIVSPSMNPVIEVYDIVVNAKVSDPAKIGIGDIITYKSKAANSEGMTITHRVVAVDKSQDGQYEYMTQGDNNSEPDSLMVTFDQVIGKEIMIIPKLGKLQFLIANRKGWLLLLLIPIGIYLIKDLAKLINLFGLRKKVTKVVEKEPEEVVIKPKFEEIEERKEQIRTTLKNNAAEKDSVVKNDKEPVSFLEQYTETKLEVKTNKYAELRKKKQQKEEPKVEEEVKVATPAKVETKEVKEVKPVIEEKIELPKIKEEVNDEYEILDTDELTTKIKEYDTKLLKLNKMIADIENIKETKPEEEKKETFVEVDNFLKGGKIKVKKIEETKNQKKKVNSKRITDPSTHKEEIKIELNPILEVGETNSRTKIARPDSVDISELRAIETKNTQTKKETTKKKKNLNLNPKEVTKVKGTKKTTKKASTTKKKLSLNPRTTQKATRNRKTVQPIQQVQPVNNTRVVPIEQPVKTKETKPKRKREPFIIIKKVK